MCKTRLFQDFCTTVSLLHIHCTKSNKEICVILFFTAVKRSAGFTCIKGALECRRNNTKLNLYVLYLDVQFLLIYKSSLLECEIAYAVSQAFRGIFGTGEVDHPFGIPRLESQNRGRPSTDTHSTNLPYGTVRIT